MDATSTSPGLPDPGSGSRVTLGGTTSGGRSAILGSRLLPSSADELMPIQSKILPSSAMPSLQALSSSMDVATAAKAVRRGSCILVPSPKSPQRQMLTATLRRDCDSDPKTHTEDRRGQQLWLHRRY